MLYGVELPEISVKQYSANVIANNMYLQVDQDGFSQTLLESIIYYSKDGHAVTKDDMYATTKVNCKRILKTTVGCNLFIKFRYGSEQWVILKILKETNPIEVSEFSTARDIADEPKFFWLVPYTLQKRDRIITAIISIARKTSQKYGIEVPRDLGHAKKLDSINGNCLWQ